MQLTSEVKATLRERQRRDIQQGEEGQEVQKGWEGGTGERAKEPATPAGGAPDSLLLGQHSHCRKQFC